jgi:competence protein ComEC
VTEWGNSRAGTRTWDKIWPARDTARLPGVPSLLPGLWWTCISQLRDWAHAEAGAGRLLPWIPVAFGAGIACYFGADHEPVAWVAASTAAGFCAAVLLLRRHRLFAPVALVAAIAAGFATATVKTAWIGHAVLTTPMYSVSLKGFVETREVRERTDRFVLHVTDMESPRAQTRLERVRLSVKKGTAPDVGSFVELKARLQPPLEPMRPGSYDFGRDMFFQGIGASGFAMGAIKTTEPPVGGGLWLRFAAAMQGLRDAIDGRIRMVLSGDSRAIATALLTGRRDAITTPVNDAMFISGLGHVLSISGYHMAVVAGVVFTVVRALLALIPALTVTFPIKKWSAAAALFAAAFYLLLSGSDVATQRSFFMTAVVLIAVIVDRRAVTFRTLAVAAMLVLLMFPEALVHPSFQMSFAATLGLVALIQIGMPKLFAAPDNSVTARAALWGGREIVMLSLTSLVAGFATTPYAAFHFHRVTPYGVLANLLAMPVVSVVVMPAGLMGLAAMPFGLDAVFWRIMDFGIGWMIVVTEWVAALPGAIGRMAAFGTGPLLASTAGIILFGMLRTPLRWTGAVVFALSVAWALKTPQPDILISGDGHTVGVRGMDGRLRVMRSAKDNFMVKEWLAADADIRLVDDASLTQAVSCDDAGCVAQMKGDRYATLALRPEALADDCANAAVIVTLRQVPRDCAALVIGRDQLQKRGTMVLRQTRTGFAIDAVRPKGTDRPWAPARLDDAAPDGSSPARPTSTHPVDATPAETDFGAEE